MILEQLLKLSHDILEKIKAPHALIGAFGMSVHGYQRATNDIDFLVDGDFRPQVETEFFSSGFTVFNETSEVLQLQGPGVVDIIFAKRPLSKQMLTRKNLPTILGVPVLQVEDIIGLKIQAAALNPARKFRDLGDIQALCQVNPNVDWDLIAKYAHLFGFWEMILEIKKGVKK